MWPFAADGRPSSTPAYPQQYAPLESSTDVCRRDGCSHITPGADDPTQPLPAKLWLSPACQRAWMVSQGGPIALSIASVARPAERGVEAELPWLGPPLPRPKVPTYDEVVAS